VSRVSSLARARAPKQLHHSPECRPAKAPREVGVAELFYLVIMLARRFRD